jgi:sulfopyruvate decarboxylase TPP-binding subunit
MRIICASAVVELVRSEQITHWVWIPDSAMGEWDASLAAIAELVMIRPAREGEAIAIAGGLWVGGSRPIVAMQCTGFYEAGDALRNIVHDLGIPLFVLIGCRSYFARREGSSDSAPDFLQPIARAWQLPFSVLDSPIQDTQLATMYRVATAEGRPHAVLIAE